jgi:pimeloyl-ACP methyl ester carboxylesterase
MAALGAAAMLPNLARALVLLDPPLAQAMSSSWPKSTSDFIGGVRSIIEGHRTAQDVLAETLPGITDAQARWFADTFSRVDLGVVKTLIEGRLFESFDVTTLLRQLECPTLMIHGDTDKGALVRDEDVEFFVAQARDGSTVRIRDAGHFLHAQKPEEVLAAVEDWFKSKNRSEPSPSAAKGR